MITQSPRLTELSRRTSSVNNARRLRVMDKFVCDMDAEHASDGV